MYDLPMETGRSDHGDAHGYKSIWKLNLPCVCDVLLNTKYVMLLMLLHRAPKSILKLPVLQRMRPKQTKTSRKPNSISHLMRLQRLVVSWVKGVFDRQTPDIEVFADPKT
ncbi:uncharacterized protein LAJ45_06643 [Morchella importuna]|uniref:uncharacterized protein n=1 Tax=Morchella importuna TaxID=1174673 RepID=UPI001E8E657E|nr:uncharacterized protein LAJ45_06643 [Morchella importuna]KAH8149104.1 hypothetical protein LAJ45_06643 [Morchella importuna]